MKNYIITLTEDPCNLDWQGTSIRKIVDWEFRPWLNSGAKIETIENFFDGNSLKKLFVRGDYVLDQNGSLNGELSLNFECVDMVKNQSFNRLGLIQIEGYALGINSGNYKNVPANNSINLDSKSFYYDIPVGETIKIQLIGGFGHVRYVHVSDKNVINVDKLVAFEDADYQPQMKNLNSTQEQINLNFVKVDRPLGQGKHIFTIKTKSIGKGSIIFQDMMSVRYYLNLNVKANLCKDNIKIINSSGEEYDELPNRYNYNVEPILNDNDFNESLGNYCNCDIDSGGSATGNMEVTVPNKNLSLMGVNHLNKIYDNELFVRGTRSLDFNQLDKINDKNLPILPAKTYDVYVGEKVKIKIPPSAKTQYTAQIINKVNLNGEAVGAGWGEANTGPIWSPAKVEDKIVSIDENSLEISCIAPTNWLPAIIHFKPKSNFDSVSSAIPKRAKKIQVSNDSTNAILEYESVKGQKSYLEAVEIEAEDNISMTNSDFFVAIRCFCENIDFDIDPDKVYQEGEAFEIYTGGALLPKAQKFFFAKDSIKNQGHFGESNFIDNPNGDEFPEIQNGKKEFKIATIGNEKMVAFQKVPIFLIHASEQSSNLNLHRLAFRRFNDEFFVEGKFWDGVDSNSTQEFNHYIEKGEEFFPCWKEQGLSVQPRGTWCVNKKAFIFESESKMPVVEDENGNPVSINDIETRSFIVLEEQDKIRQYRAKN